MIASFDNHKSTAEDQNSLQSDNKIPQKKNQTDLGITENVSKFDMVYLGSMSKTASVWLIKPKTRKSEKSNPYNR